MTEEFLHYIWKYRLFDSYNLTTISGEKISVIKTGDHNTDSGPDFFDARIKIDKTLWAGNVEIHINSSSWKKHNHQEDNAYNNVILHVVYNDDAIAKNANGLSIPTLVLKDKFDKKLYHRYNEFIENKAWIPCENQISGADEFVKKNWLERLAAERLERKSKIILDDLKLYNNDWSEVFYIHLAKNFGLKINSEPFTLLAKSLPFSLLSKHKDNQQQMEALLLGQAGFLHEEVDSSTNIHSKEKEKSALKAESSKVPPNGAAGKMPGGHLSQLVHRQRVFERDSTNEEGAYYFFSLKKEYDFLKKKYSLEPMDVYLWKFLRMRPIAFPTIRISQFAMLLYKSDSLFSKITEARTIEQLLQLFNVNATEYWNTHYTLGKSSPKKIKRLGKDTIYSIIINTVIPFLFLYGKQKANSEYTERALKFLETLPSEKNSILVHFKKLDFKNNSALEGQSLLEMKNEYCSGKKCLNCSIGNYLLRL